MLGADAEDLVDFEQEFYSARLRQGRTLPHQHTKSPIYRSFPRGSPTTSRSGPPTFTAGGSCIGTSNRRTSWSHRTAQPKSRILGLSKEASRTAMTRSNQLLGTMSY